MTKTTFQKTILITSIATILLLMPIAATATVSPTTHSDTIPTTGGSTTVTKTVTTGSIPANPDIYFLTDSTGSMGPTITSVKTSMGSILSQIATAEPTAQFAVGEYKDIFDSITHQTTQSMTTNQAAVLGAINALFASGGGDSPEAQLCALEKVATDGSIGFRSGTSNIIVWFGDRPGHDPRNCVGKAVGLTTISTQASAISALTAGSFTVVAIDTGSLDSTGQATAITVATSGVLTTVAAGNAGAAVLAAIQQLTTTITPSASCNGGLSISFSPSSHTGVGGSTSVQFTETVTVPAGTVPGMFQCTITFLDSAGASLGTQTVSITVPPIAVDIDIKPGSDPSSVNCEKLKGTVPVAVFGSADFDVSTIDLS
ncbi:MAG: VWA domain-containing protein, partial [Thaumarchaeota archaeon]|nr:VWA domain-containing protein [Nitrososphaerota archaeon]